VAIAHRGAIHAGRVEVRRAPRRHALRVAVSPSLARVVPAVLSRVKHAFDLTCDPAVVAAALGDLAAAHPGLRVPGTFDGFELAVRAVVGQQISVRGARTVLGRIARAFGEPIEAASDKRPALLFPAASRLAACEPAELTSLGLTSARARTIVALASAVASGDIVLLPDGDVEDTVKKLLALPGIGPWTAHYVAMRALRWPDAFLAGDLVVLRAMGETQPARALAKSEAWRPWRAYAVLHLWRKSA
jgi:AraC family transcriptional regulator of adaptative response / DNA-3-methyladenine glycosylase II